MIRIYCILLLVFAPTLGHAADDSSRKFDGVAVAEIYYEIRSSCRSGETVDGRILTDEESNKQCLILDALGEQLIKHGYCWDQGEQEWAFCEISQ